MSPSTLSLPLSLWQEIAIDVCLGAATIVISVWIFYIIFCLYNTYWRS